MFPRCQEDRRRRHAPSTASLRAISSAVELALGHLVDEYGIVIDDWNYSAFLEQRQELLVVLEGLEAARKGAIHAEQEKDEMVRSVKDVCLQLGGKLLPLRAGGPCGFEYVGPDKRTRSAGPRSCSVSSAS